MKKELRRITAVALAVAMAGSLAACGGGKTATQTTTAAPTTTAAAKTEETTAAKAEDTTAAPAAEETTAAPAPESKLTGPITISVWHSRGAGEQLEEMQRVVEAFNETNDKQITVQEEYVGSNKEVTSKVVTAIAGGNNCQVVVGGAMELAPEGVIADMLPFAQRDGFDVDNILSGFARGMFYEGQLVQLPYIRSTAVLYYNKDIFKEVGCETIPGDIHEFKKVLEKIRDEKGIPGFGMEKAPDFVQGAMIKSINGLGNVSEDGLSPASLDDGSLKTVTEWWLEGINDGTIMNFTVKEAGNNFKNALYAGELASFAASCAGMAGILKHCRESGVDIGVAPIPGFKGEAISSPGGQNLYILSANNTDEQIEAAWEFVKFALSDEQMGYNCTNTGYLPVTYTAGDDPKMKEFWAKEENKTYKDAYEILKLAVETPSSPYVSKWHKEIQNIWDSVLLEQSMTVDEGMATLDAERSQYWP